MRTLLALLMRTPRIAPSTLALLTLAGCEGGEVATDAAPEETCMREGECGQAPPEGRWTVACAEPYAWEWTLKSSEFRLESWNASGSITLTEDEGEYQVADAAVEVSYRYFERRPGVEDCSVQGWEPDSSGGCARTVEHTETNVYTAMVGAASQGWGFTLGDGTAAPGWYDACISGSGWEWASVSEFTLGTYIGLLVFEPG